MENSVPIRNSSATEGNVFMNCNNVDKHHTYHRRISRLSSSESTECPGSIFDYYSAHPSVELDDFCSESIDFDETANTGNRVSAEVVAHGKGDANGAGSVIHDEAEFSLAETVIASRSSEVTANAAVLVNCESVAPSGASKLPQSSSGLPTSSLRMPSRLPAPHSRAATKAGNHHASKSDQHLSGPAVSSAGFNAGSKVAPSRFH